MGIVEIALKIICTPEERKSARRITWVLEELRRDGDRLTSARKRLEREIDDEESQYYPPRFMTSSMVVSVFSIICRERGIEREREIETERQRGNTWYWTESDTCTKNG